jgi:hypothetical protein
MDALDPNVVITGLVTIIVTWMGLSNRRAIRKVHNEVKTNDGKRAGDYIEATARELATTRLEATLGRVMAEQAASEARAAVRGAEEAVTLAEAHDQRDMRAFAYLGVPDAVIDGDPLGIVRNAKAEATEGDTSASS